MSYMMNWRLNYNYRNADNYPTSRINDYGVIEGETVESVINQAVHMVLSKDATKEIMEIKGEKYAYESFDYDFEDLTVKPEVMVSEDEIDAMIEAHPKYIESIELLKKRQNEIRIRNEQTARQLRLDKFNRMKEELKKEGII